MDLARKRGIEVVERAIWPDELESFQQMFLTGSAAEVARALRFLLIPLGAALLVTPFLYGANGTATAASLLCGLALIGLSLRRGRIAQRYGGWQRLIV